MQTFEPDQLVLVRECDTADWELARYSHRSSDGSNGHIHHEQGRRWFKDDEILPYFGNEHLLGTTGTPTPKWEPKPGESVAVKDRENTSWRARVFANMDEHGRYRCFCSHDENDRYVSWDLCEPLRKHFLVLNEGGN